MNEGPFTNEINKRKKRLSYKHPETVQPRNYGLRAIVLQTPSFSCAAPDEKVM